MKNLIFITGATGTSKTAVAREITAKLSTGNNISPIISCDSVQCLPYFPHLSNLERENHEFVAFTPTYTDVIKWTTGVMEFIESTQFEYYLIVGGTAMYAERLIKRLSDREENHHSEKFGKTEGNKFEESCETTEDTKLPIIINNQIGTFKIYKFHLKKERLNLYRSLDLRTENIVENGIDEIIEMFELKICKYQSEKLANFTTWKDITDKVKLSDEFEICFHSETNLDKNEKLTNLNTIIEIEFVPKDHPLLIGKKLPIGVHELHEYFKNHKKIRILRRPTVNCAQLNEITANDLNSSGLQTKNSSMRIEQKSDGENSNFFVSFDAFVPFLLKVQKSTRNYARRQETYLNSRVYQRIWIDENAKSADQIINFLKNREKVNNQPDDHTFEDKSADYSRNPNHKNRKPHKSPHFTLLKTYKPELKYLTEEKFNRSVLDAIIKRLK